MPTTGDAIADLYQQAANIIGASAGPEASEHAATAYKTLTTFASYGDHLSLGLFPLALALLIFHENYQAATNDGRFRVAHVLGRAAAIAVLIHPWTYGRLCGLITYAAGGHGGWLSSSALLGSVTKSVDGLKGAWVDYVGDDPGVTDVLSNLLNMLPLLAIWLILVASLLLAYIAGALLSLSQAVLLSILLAVGKTCLTVTLVPGVGLGSSWARSLAKVAAWSTIGAILTGLMVQKIPNIQLMVHNMAYTSMLKTTGQFVVLAVCTLAIPGITERIFSGAAPAGTAAFDAVSKGWHGAKSFAHSYASRRNAHDSASFSDGQGAPSGSPGSPRGGSFGGWGGGGGHRPHKVSASRLREGLGPRRLVAVGVASEPLDTAPAPAVEAMSEPSPRDTRRARTVEASTPDALAVAASIGEASTLADVHASARPASTRTRTAASSPRSSSHGHDAGGDPSTTPPSEVPRSPRLDVSSAAATAPSPPAYSGTTSGSSAHLPRSSSLAGGTRPPSRSHPARAPERPTALAEGSMRAIGVPPSVAQEMTSRPLASVPGAGERPHPPAARPAASSPSTRPQVPTAPPAEPLAASSRSSAVPHSNPPHAPPGRTTPAPPEAPPPTLRRER